MDLILENELIGVIKIAEIEVNELENTLDIIKRSGLIHNIKEEEDNNSLDFSKPFCEQEQETECRNDSLPRTYDEDGNEKEYIEEFNRIICPSCKQGGAISSLNNHYIFDYTKNILYKINRNNNEDYIELTDGNNRINKEYYIELINDLDNLNDKVKENIIVNETLYECPCCKNNFTGREMAKELKKYDYSFCPICNSGELDPIISLNGISIKCTTKECIENKNLD